jgi:vacuolar-type H+-ATPase subunit I/STV1
MSTDFFDDDLLQKDAEDSSGKDEDPKEEVQQSTETPGQAGHKEEITSKMAGTVRELELLRKKQQTLEKDKETLEALSRKQEEYDREKKEIAEKLRKGAVLLEKEQVQASKMEELFSETRNKFQEMLSEVEGMDESSWPNENFEQRLDEALSRIENVRLTYSKALSRIEASSWHKNLVKNIPQQQDVSHPAGDSLLERGFFSLAKAGAAFSLPLVISMIILFIAWLWASGIWPLR